MLFSIFAKEAAEVNENNLENSSFTLAIPADEVQKIIYSSFRISMLAWTPLLLFLIPRVFSVKSIVPLCIMPMVIYFTRRRLKTRSALLLPQNIIPQLAVVTLWFLVVFLLIIPNYVTALCLLPISVISYCIWSKYLNERIAVLPVLIYMACALLFYGQYTRASWFCFITFVLPNFFCYMFLYVCTSRNLICFSNKDKNGEGSVYVYDKWVSTNLFILFYVSSIVFMAATVLPGTPITWEALAANVLYSSIVFICYIEDYTLVIIKSFHIK